MRPFLLTSFLLLLTVGILRAQTFAIRGKVSTVDAGALPGGIVSLTKAADSTFVKAALTEKNGSFELVNLPAGLYRISVTHLGYAAFRSEPLTLDAGHPVLTLPPVTLQTSEKALGEVKVVARKPFVEQRIDRVVVNPDALISNAGTTALEVLEKSPGISVDANGLLSLRGRSGVVVFVDDKPTYLNAADLASYLRSLPAGSVESVEIMTNPPAKYDAAGNAGVINIRLKKTRAKGLNGGWNVAFGQGRYSRSNNSANLNYRTGQLNFFANAGLNSNNTYQDLTIWREYFTPSGSPSSAFTQNSYIKRRLNSATLKAGVDWYVSPKSTVGIVFSGFRNPTKSTITNNARVFDGMARPTARVEALTLSDRVLSNASVNLNYNYRFDSTSREGGPRELSANVDYLNYNSELLQTLTNNVFASDQPANRTVLESSLPSIIDIRTAKVDYLHPIRKGARVEAGFKGSDIRTSNVADFYDLIDNRRERNEEFSNHFDYAEQIGAAYLNLNLERGRFSVQTGLRFENTAIRGNQRGNSMAGDSSFTRRYNGLFPTFYATYRLDTTGRHQLGFSFGRRIDRPNYQDMNPFTYPLDRFTLYGGNPFLRPTFSNNLELSHTLNGTLTTSLRYSQTKDVIMETIEQGGTVFYSRPGNFGRLTSFGLAVNGTLQPVKWWTLQLYSELIYNRFRAQLYGQALDNSGTYWHVAPTNQFRINARWNAELGGMFQTRAYAGQFVVRPMGQVRLGVARKIWHERGTVKLAVSDVFYTYQVGGTIKGIANSTARWYSYLDSRVATLSLTYRFSKGQTLRGRQTGSSENEQQRVRN